MNLLHVASLLICVYQIKCSKILFLGTFPAHSHFTIAFSLAKELADRGHEVTFVNPFPQKNPVKNLKDVPVLEVIDYLEEKRKEFLSHRHRQFYETVLDTFEMGHDVAEIALQSKNFVNLINSKEKYDVIIMEWFYNEIYVGLGYHFNAPVVILSSMASSPLTNYLVANPNCPSYAPNILTPVVGKMNFWERLENLWSNVVIGVVRQLSHIPKQKKLFKKYISSDVDLEEVLYNNISLLFVNSHVSFNNPLPQVPAVVEIGGYHVSPPKSLPKELQEFMDNSKNGVVLFSMGSNLKSKDLKPEVRAAILKSFSKIKQNVLWKFETTLPEAPSNVKIMSWLPQQEIMAHPNTKAFISHGGLLGTIEAVYHGVPIIGIPIYGDQHNNIKRATDHGFALGIALDDINVESFSYVLDQILNNPKYQENVKKRSRLIQNQPMSPRDLAVYWVEHIIQHKGAPHLRSAGLDLTWYQRELIDVFAFLAAAVVLSLYILSKIVRLAKSFLCKSKKEKVNFQENVHKKSN